MLTRKLAIDLSSVDVSGLTRTELLSALLDAATAAGSDPLSRCGRLAEFADNGDGHWITIGAHGSGDDRHGGTPVFIKDGRIVKGAPSLTGKRIDALKEDASDLGSHRAQLKASREHARAVWGKEARKIGHDPKHLHALAGEMLAHDRAAVEDRTAALKSARKTIESYHGDWRGIQFRAARGGDSSRTKGIDVAADQLARQYPHLFPNQETEHNTDRLFEMLAAGNPTPMSEDEAYAQALDQLRQYPSSPPQEKEYRGPRGDAHESGRRKAKAAVVDDVPFSSDSAPAYRVRSFAVGMGPPDHAETASLASDLARMTAEGLRALRLRLGVPASRRPGLVAALARRMR